VSMDFEKRRILDLRSRFPGERTFSAFLPAVERAIAR
jgi:hypothetical protein